MFLDGMVQVGLVSFFTIHGPSSGHVLSGDGTVAYEFITGTGTSPLGSNGLRRHYSNVASGSGNFFLDADGVNVAAAQSVGVNADGSVVVVSWNNTTLNNSKVQVYRYTGTSGSGSHNFDQALASSSGNEKIIVDYVSPDGNNVLLRFFESGTRNETFLYQYDTSSTTWSNTGITGRPNNSTMVSNNLLLRTDTIIKIT